MSNVRRKGKWKRVAMGFTLKNEGKKYLLFSKEGENCDCYGGKLKMGLHATPYLAKDGSTHTCAIANVKNLFILKVYNESNRSYDERFGALTKNGFFYAQQKNGEYIIIASGFDNAGVERFIGTDLHHRTLLVDDTKCVFYKDDGTFEAVMFPDTAKVGCFYNHRVFVGLSRGELACSAPEDEIEFTESIHDGGLIRFSNVGGEIVAIKAYLDALYVFFEYGVLRLNVAGSTKNFSAMPLVYKGGKIHGATVCVGNEGIYFLSDDGVYRVRGEKVERLEMTGFKTPEMEEDECVGLLAGRVLIRYTTKDGVQTLVFYEDGEENFYVAGLPPFTYSEGGRCLFIGEDQVVYSLSDVGDGRFENGFYNAETDFGVMGRKTLTNLQFEGEGKFLLTVKTGGRKFQREVEFVNGKAMVSLSERGDWFVFDFQLSSNTLIHGMTATLKITI